MSRSSLFLIVIGTVLVASCDGRRQPARPLAVERVLPRSSSAGTGTESEPERLWLNSKLTIHFTEDIDPLSVTADAVRIVKITEQGPQRVAMARREVGARTVVLHPELPVTPTLDDGSFVPDQLYRLEVAGFPRLNTVMARSGASMGRTFRRYFRVVSRQAKDPGPLLPVGLPTDPFDLVTRRLHMAADARTVRLHFTLPVDPTTLSPKSVRFTLGPKADIAVESLRVVAVPPPIGMGYQAYPGSAVELRLVANSRFDAGRFFGVDLRPAGLEQHWIRDYRGRAVTGASAMVSGVVHAGGKVAVIRFDQASDFLFRRADPGAPTFEFRDGRMQPLVRVEFGHGRHGVFHPVRDTVLAPGVLFDRGDGRRQIGGDRFEFTEIYIPKGVTVTLRARPFGGAVDVVVAGHVRIDGTLRLETNHAMGPTEFETPRGKHYLERVVERDFGCRLACAGHLVVNGQILHHLPDETKASPLVLIAKRLALHGAFPAGSILAQDPDQVPLGAAPSSLQVVRESTPGFQKGHEIVAAGWTPWMQLPADFTGDRISARAIDVQGEVETWIQVASPDPVDRSVPYPDPAGLSEPRRLPLRQSIPVRERVFVRFLLRARVRGGVPLPSLRALIVYAD